MADPSTFERVARELNDGCSCACHTGLGSISACAHCSKTSGEGRVATVASSSFELLPGAPTDGRAPLHEVALAVAELLREDEDDCGPCAVSRCLGAAWCSLHHAGRALQAAAEWTAGEVDR